MHTEPSIMQCALGWTPTGTLVIVWRGTANRNVLTDIKFFSRKVIPVYMLPFLTLQFPTFPVICCCLRRR